MEKESANIVQVTIPFNCASLEALHRNIDVENDIIDGVEKGAQTLNLKSQLNIKLDREKNPKLIYKVRRLRNKQDPAKEIKLYTLIGVSDTNYTFKHFTDFNFDPFLPDQTFMDAFISKLPHLPSPLPF